MSRESLVLLIGIIVFFTPFLNVPEVWKQYVIAGSGLVLFVVGYFLRRAAYLRQTSLSDRERGTDSFVESEPLLEEEEAEFV